MDMSNRTLAMFLVAAIVVSVAGTFISLNTLESLPSGVTGYATTDTGIINLSIADSLNIEVDSTYDILDYAACTPDAGTDLVVRLDDSSFQTGSSWRYNCTGDRASPQYLIVRNIGNINANVSVTAECSSDTMLGTVAGGDVNLSSVGCVGIGADADIPMFEISTSPIKICSNVTASNPGNLDDEFNVTSAARIPSDATGGTGLCADNQNTLTFTAQKNY